MSTKNGDFLNWEGVLGHIGRGLNNLIFVGIFQYVVKLKVIGSLSEAHMAI